MLAVCSNEWFPLRDETLAGSNSGSVLGRLSSTAGRPNVIEIMEHAAPHSHSLGHSTCSSDALHNLQRICSETVPT